MAAMETREMVAEYEYFISTCSHVNESDEADACVAARPAADGKEARRGPQGVGFR